MKEALCIQSTPADSRFNRDGGYELPDCWFALNRKLRGGAIVAERPGYEARVEASQPHGPEEVGHDHVHSLKNLIY